MNNNSRISRDDAMIAIAEIIARRSTCERLKVGAVIAIDNRIVSTGYNGKILLPTSSHTCDCDVSLPCTDTIHAEQNAIAFAAKYGVSLNGAKLYVTHSPCKYCSDIIIQSGITEVIYKEAYRVSSDSYLELNKVKVRKYEK